MVTGQTNQTTNAMRSLGDKSTDQQPILQKDNEDGATDQLKRYFETVR